MKECVLRSLLDPAQLQVNSSGLPLLCLILLSTALYYVGATCTSIPGVKYCAVVFVAK